MSTANGRVHGREEIAIGRENRSVALRSGTMKWVCRTTEGKHASMRHLEFYTFWVQKIISGAMQCSAQKTEARVDLV